MREKKENRLFPTRNEIPLESCWNRGYFSGKRFKKKKKRKRKENETFANRLADVWEARNISSPLRERERERENVRTWNFNSTLGEQSRRLTDSIQDRNRFLGNRDEKRRNNFNWSREVVGCLRKLQSERKKENDCDNFDRSSVLQLILISIDVYVLLSEDGLLFLIVYKRRLSWQDCFRFDKMTQSAKGKEENDLKYLVLEMTLRRRRRWNIIALKWYLFSCSWNCFNFMPFVGERRLYISKETSLSLNIWKVALKCLRDWHLGKL